MIDLTHHHTCCYRSVYFVLIPDAATILSLAGDSASPRHHEQEPAARNMEKRQHQEERDVQSSSIDRPAADSPVRPSIAALAVSSWCIAAMPSRSTPKQRRPRATGQEDIIKPLHPTCDRWRGYGRQRRVGLVAVEVFCPEERQQRRCRFQDRAFIPRPTGGDHTHALCLQTCRHV